MNSESRAKSNWRNTLGALALGITAIVGWTASAGAAPKTEELRLAQVRVYSNVNVPTPLNLRPKVHIGIPRSDRDRYHRPYRGHYDNYGRHRHYDPNYRHRRRSHYPHHRKHRRGGAKVIIIAPGHRGHYGNYGSYGRHRDRSYGHYRKGGSYIQIGF